jgi:GntR family phosphonate transport system transcriptional regulator
MAVWRQIADILSTEIRNRVYAETGKLPSENDLADRFDVNRHTLRQAISALQSEGLVCIEPGRGSFIQQDMLDYLLSRRTRFTDNLIRQGLLPNKHLVGARVIPATDIVAKELKIRKNSKILRVEMIDQANERPVGMATSYYPAARFPGLLDMLAEGRRTTEVLRHFGIEDYFRFESRVTTIMPTEEMARTLKQAHTRPVLCVESVDVDVDGIPIKYGETIFCGDRVQLIVSLDDKA